MKENERKEWMASLMYGCPVHPMSWEDSIKFRDSQNSKRASKCEVVDFKDAMDESWWNFYGGRPNVSNHLCRTLWDDINNGASIDWSKMKAMDVSYEQEFGGTDEEPTTIKILRGVLFLSNGNKYPWIAHCDRVQIVCEVIESWVEEEVLKKVFNKIKKNENYSMYRGV